MSSSASPLLFLSGWPACGETHYGEWIAARFDYRHLDLAAARPEDAEWLALWRKLCPERARSFAKALQKAHPRWVLTGPIPTEDLKPLEGLRDAGFALWFFQARTEGVSRQRWLLLERELDPAVRPAGWEKQADAIRRGARGLRPFFRDRCVETLNSACELLPEEELAARIGLSAAP